MAAPHEQNGHTDQLEGAAAFSQALKELQRGEAAAAALENHLSAVEKKINDLLASAEANQQLAKEKMDESEDQATDKAQSSEVDTIKKGET